MTFDRSQIPAMPRIAAQAIQLSNTPNVDMKQLVDLLSADIGIAAAILELANSALFGSQGSTANLALALARIGMDNLQNILIKSAINEVFPLKNLPTEYGWRELWEHLLLSGQIAYRLAKHLHCPKPRDVQMAALLHDVGIFLMGFGAPETLVEITNECKRFNKTFSEVESRFGNDFHGSFGQDLAMAWHLPISVVSAIRYHECNWRNELPSISSNHLQTLFVVSTANILALNHGPRPIGFPAVQELRKDLFEGFYIDEGVMKNAVRESLEFLEQVR